jgi:hypothetical protein
MKLTEKQQRIFTWIRNICLLFMTLGGIMAGFNFAFLPAHTPQVGGIVAAIAGGISTWAAGLLPGGGGDDSGLDTGPPPDKVQ